MLLHGIENNITWGKTATRYEVGESNKDSPVTVHFSDGSRASGTRLVGADGGQSNIRRQPVPQHRIIDPEFVCLYGRTYQTKDLETRIQPNLLRNF